MRDWLRMDELIASLQEHFDYQGVDVLIEKIDDDKIMITIVNG